MVLQSKRDHNYRLYTPKRKDIIIDTLKQRLIAEGDKSWFSLSNITINYKLMRVEDDRLVISRDGVMPNSMAGRGIIIVSFREDIKNGTLITATITPADIVATQLFIAIIAVPITLVILSVAPFWISVIYTLISWALFFALATFTANLKLWRLESYLSSVLLDLGIDEEMEEYE